MKVAKIIGLAVLAIIVILAVVVLIQPAKGHIEQSIVINASPADVFTHVNSLKKMNVWSPWAKMDPEATYVFEGPEEGVGAKMSWNGPKTGKGTQWVESSEVNERVKNGLTFDGYEGTSYSEITLAPEGAGTKVTWTYDGDNKGIAGKAMWIMMGSMMKSQFADGLIDLKKVVENK